MFITLRSAPSVHLPLDTPPHNESHNPTLSPESDIVVPRAYFSSRFRHDESRFGKDSVTFVPKSGNRSQYSRRRISLRNVFRGKVRQVRTMYDLAISGRGRQSAKSRWRCHDHSSINPGIRTTSRSHLAPSVQRSSEFKGLSDQVTSGFKSRGGPRKVSIPQKRDSRPGYLRLAFGCGSGPAQPSVESKKFPAKRLRPLPDPMRFFPVSGR